VELHVDPISIGARTGSNGPRDFNIRGFRSGVFCRAKPERGKHVFHLGALPGDELQLVRVSPFALTSDQPQLVPEPRASSCRWLCLIEPEFEAETIAVIWSGRTQRQQIENVRPGFMELNASRKAQWRFRSRSTPGPAYVDRHVLIGSRLEHRLDLPSAGRLAPGVLDARMTGARRRICIDCRPCGHPLLDSQTGCRNAHSFTVWTFSHD
jgi:hypothetical protein